MSGKEYANDREALIEETKEIQQEREQERQAFVNDLRSESDAEVIETPVTLFGDYTATVECKLSGEVLQRIEYIDENMPDEEGFERGDPAKLNRVADQLCILLDDMLAEATYDHETFDEVYQLEGWDPLITVWEKVGDAIEKEQERRRGSADGFR